MPLFRTNDFYRVQREVGEKIAEGTFLLQEMRDYLETEINARIQSKIDDARDDLRVEAESAGAFDTDLLAVDDMGGYGEAGARKKRVYDIIQSVQKDISEIIVARGWGS